MRELYYQWLAGKDFEGLAKPHFLHFPLQDLGFWGFEFKFFMKFVVTGTVLFIKIK